MSKKDIKQRAQLLRRSGKLDPSTVTRESPEEQLRALGQEERSARTFDAAADCADCARERREKQDESALCREHLAKALGF